MPVEKINAIGCDGTPTNTGWKGGGIRLLEELWKKTIAVEYLFAAYE